METVLICGGTGLVGRHLSQRLIEKGYRVAFLSRRRIQDPDIQNYFWNPDQNEIEETAIETADYIIHLAGANIGGKRWSLKRRQLILDSRVKTGMLIFKSVKTNKHKPKAFISASAIGYYGAITSDHVFQETDPNSNDFLGEVCRQWEQIADSFKDLGIRTVKIRTGIVLAKEEGALAKMIVTVKSGIGSAIGNGQQYLPWIHIDDLCNIYIKAIEDMQMKGAYNAVAPDSRTNSDFTKTLASVLKKPFWFPNVPAIVMKIIFGRMSELLLKGSRVSSDKIQAAGYSYLFPDLESALTDLTGEK
jgi:uncharacterized protein